MATPRREAESDLARTLLDEYPDEVARILETANDRESAALLERAAADASVNVLYHLTPDRAARIVGMLSPEALRRIAPSMNPNRLASLLQRLDREERERCLQALGEPLATELNELAAYSPDTAGAIMDPRVTTFRPDATVRDVVRRLRRFRNRRIQDVFLVAAEGRLEGSVSLQDLVLADPATRLEALPEGAPISVRDVDSLDKVVETFGMHRLTSLPVVDFEGRLLGVLRQRQFVQAANEEATASAVTMVGAGEDERALSSPWFAMRKRLPWLQVNLLSAFLAAAVVGIFEETIAQVTALAVLLPVVAGQSGNTGAQALAVTMRGLALREVRTRNWLQVAIKEVAAGAGNGVAVALTTSAAVFVWSGSLGLALVIAVSMVISMTLAGLAGAVIPMVLTGLRQDPAQSSSIVLTTVTDVTGFFSFLGIATLLASRI